VNFINGLEKLGRFALWMTISATLIVIPLGVNKSVQESARREQLARSEEQKQAAALAKEKEEEARPKRIKLDDVNPYLLSLNTSTAMGNVYFSNVSPRSGVICLSGTAGDASTGNHTESLPSCLELKAYESNIHMTVVFADSEIKKICPTNKCTLRVEDVPDRQ